MSTKILTLLVTEIVAYVEAHPEVLQSLFDLIAQEIKTAVTPKV